MSNPPPEPVVGLAPAAAAPPEGCGRIREAQGRGLGAAVVVQVGPEHVAPQGPEIDREAANAISGSILNGWWLKNAPPSAFGVLHGLDAARPGPAQVARPLAEGGGRLVQVREQAKLVLDPDQDTLITLTYVHSTRFIRIISSPLLLHLGHLRGRPRPLGLGRPPPAEGRGRPETASAVSESKVHLPTRGREIMCMLLSS